PRISANLAGRPAVRGGGRPASRLRRGGLLVLLRAAARPRPLGARADSPRRMGGGGSAGRGRRAGPGPKDACPRGEGERGGPIEGRGPPGDPAAGPAGRRVRGVG